MQLTVLGSGSATPTLGKSQSAFILAVHQQLILIDCGEGTQYRCLEYGIKFNSIEYICISHLHGDHYLGLVGLLSTLHSWGRRKPIKIFAPPGLKEILSLHFRYQQTSLDFDIHLIETIQTSSQVLVDTPYCSIQSFPLRHRIHTCGFLIQEKQPERKLIKERVHELDSKAALQLLKMGNDVLDDDGNVQFSADEYTHQPIPPKSFAYCSDTIFDLSLSNYIKQVNVLYHEATFLEEKKDRATETHHSTAIQAATLAKHVEAKKLIIGHPSTRYKQVELLLSEAQSVFQDVEFAYEGKSWNW